MIKIRKMVIHCEIDIPDADALAAFKNEIADKFATARKNITATHEELSLHFNPNLRRGPRSFEKKLTNK